MAEETPSLVEISLKTGERERWGLGLGQKTEQHLACGGGKLGRKKSLDGPT